MNDIPEAFKEKVAKWRNFKRERPEKIEIPGPGQESVWEYPRPPRVEPVRERVRVEFAGTLLASSDRALRVLETAGPPVYYIPPEDVRLDYLKPSEHTSLCEWKGISRYWSIEIGDRRSANAAWSYPSPWVGYESIRDAIAFYAGRVDACFVGEERVRPQPGHYYGGWITAKVVGPFKGEPGTENW